MGALALGLALVQAASPVAEPGFVGYGGCNRFSAAYSRVGETLTAHAPWGSTRRACAEPVMNRERRLLEILTRPVRISLPDPDTLLLTGEGGAIRLVRTREEP